MNGKLNCHLPHKLLGANVKFIRILSGVYPKLGSTSLAKDRRLDHASAQANGPLATDFLLNMLGKSQNLMGDHICLTKNIKQCYLGCKSPLGDDDFLIKDATWEVKHLPFSDTPSTHDRTNYLPLLVLCPT